MEVIETVYPIKKGEVMEALLIAILQDIIFIEKISHASGAWDISFIFINHKRYKLLKYETSSGES